MPEDEILTEQKALYTAKDGKRAAFGHRKR